MKNVLLVNRKTTNCGVHQYGLNIFESLEKSNKNKYFYLETNDSETLTNFLNNKYCGSSNSLGFFNLSNTGLPFSLRYPFKVTSSLPTPLKRTTRSVIS
jgi:hypothetical protein